jgi:hypothetical protein
MISTLLIFTMFVSLSFYRRYFPIVSVPCSNRACSQIDQVVKIDLRDYNKSYGSYVDDTIQIPVAYLKRHMHEIQGDQVFVIASNKVEKNIGIRILQNKGYKVIGFKLTECDCKCNILKLI